MASFGFFPREARTSSPPPHGYAAANVRIGQLNETIFVSLSMWTIEDYLNHWKKTAHHCTSKPDTVLLCSDLAPENASVFVGFSAQDGYDFEEWIIPRARLTVDGPRIAKRGVWKLAPEAGASRWHVADGVIKQFADSEPERL